MDKRKTKKDSLIKRKVEIKKINKYYNFIFSYENLWASTKEGFFTNFLKNEKEFITMHRQIFQIICRASRIKSDALFLEDHCSIVKDDKRDLIKKILENKEKKFNPEGNNKKNKETVEQLLTDRIVKIGFVGGIRIFGAIDGDLIRILLIDYHHLIYPNVKYNTLDYNKYNFCPQTKEL